VKLVNNRFGRERQNMHEEVKKLLLAAKIRFAKWLEIYKPWHGVNGITERNLSFQFATAFLEHYSEGLALMEVPFAASIGGRRHNHLDAYFHTAEFDLLLECKIVYAMSDVLAIADDIERMGPGLIQQIHERHVGPKPRPTYGVVMAETWRYDIAEWWQGKDKALPRWPRNCLRDDWHYDFVKVFQENKNTEGTLYWLYGVSPELSTPIS